MTRGDGNNTTIRLQLVHFDGTTYTSVRTAVQTTSLTGFRTFDFTLGTPQTVAPGEFLSITATDAVINQSIEVAGVRLSTTSATWLNPVQPLVRDTITMTAANGTVGTITFENDGTFTFSGAINP